jgi:benzoyl-CoA 2,3-dioxygenase component B
MNALNERLRDDFIKDVGKGIKRWNKVIEGFGLGIELRLPHRAFNRRIGVFSEVCITPAGDIVDAQAWQEKCSNWLPTATDRDYLRSLMSKPTYAPGQFANWIAPPARGINDQSIEFDCVRFD